jgi:uncharacterized protein (DUF433 family)
MPETIYVSKRVYQAVVKEATSRHQSPDQFVEEWLTYHLLPQHPHVEIVESRSGSRAVIKATRVGVDIIVGYHRAGYTPEQIVTELLPHLTLAQVYDALAYYHDHADEIDALLETNTTEAWQERLRQRMGDTAYAKLAGDAAQA